MGASWVQKRILEDHPHSDIKVYVVWFNMLSGDSREGRDGYLVPDSRATNLWDEDHLTSAALGPSVKGAAPPVWDAYLLYGPDARWSSAPPRPISTGATIYATRGKLQKDVLPLLREGK
jgi:hypothetical protein